MIVSTVAQLNALPAGSVVYDRDLETYRKRADGRWAYPSEPGNTNLSIAPNPMMRCGPLQLLETIPGAPIKVVGGISELQDLPPGSVVQDRVTAVKFQTDSANCWLVAGKAKPWTTLHLALNNTFPIKVLYQAGAQS